MPESIYRFKVGQLDCLAVQDVCYTTRLDLLYPEITKEELAQAAAKYGFDADNIIMPYWPLVVNTGDRRVLIDTGYGKGIHSGSQMWTNLASIGLKPTDFQAVIVSHLHLDHYAGLVDKSGAILCPNATIFMGQGEWDYATSDAGIAEEEKFMKNYRKVLAQYLLPLQPQTQFLADAAEILPGIRFLRLPGHTMHHSGVLIESNGESLLYIGDAAVHPLNLLQPHWRLGSDVDGDQAWATRQRIVKLATEQNAWVYGFHFPPPVLGHIRSGDTRWQWEFRQL